MKIIYLFLFSSVLLLAEQLNCLQYAHINHETKAKKIFTKEEQKSAPPFVMNISQKLIYVNLPSGKKEKFNLKDIINGEKRYFSKSNYYLRQPPKYPDVWYWDMRIRGQLQTIMLICK